MLWPKPKGMNQAVAIDLFFFDKISLLGFLVNVVHKIMGKQLIIESLNKQDALFSYPGIGTYAFSWGMLGLGLLMAVPEGIKYSRSLVKKAWGSCLNLFG